jgi:hypothetical protein
MFHAYIYIILRIACQDKSPAMSMQGVLKVGRINLLKFIINE